MGLYLFEESKEEYEMMQQPFAQPEPPRPVPILPLRYCEFRTASQEYGDATPEVSSCAYFASDEIEGMFFCLQHAGVVAHALDVLKEAP